MQGDSLYLTDDQKNMWAEAGATFPGEQLDKVIQRALVELPQDQAAADFYEIRRLDAPNAFDALLKLQNSGLARRHVEVGKHQFCEVLRVEATLLDLIMQAITMLLDVFLRVLSGTLKGTVTASVLPLQDPPAVRPIPAPLRPKRQLRIERDEECSL